MAGLIAAIECAERGAAVDVLEARSRVGGRARSTPAPYIANLGPHALYTGGSLWNWLGEHRLTPPTNTPDGGGIRLRWRGEIIESIPPGVLSAIASLGGTAPTNDRSFSAWAAERCGEETAAALSGLAGNLTFDHDPGRLAADFVWQRLRRITFAGPASSRYVVGGWSSLVEHLAQRALALGVKIRCDAKVDDIDALPAGPVIVAVGPASARRLLGDPALTVESPRVALLDVALTSVESDPYLVVDLDEAAFVDRFTAVDPSMAPPGEELVQACVGLRPGEVLGAGVCRLERLLDQTFDDWRARVRWKRRGAVQDSTGALQLPGTTWADRPPIDQRPGLWLAGDWVAADGHLAEVSCASAVQAAAAATATT